MKISVLMENTARPGFAAEHGLSLLVETRGQTVLFDMGQTGAFAGNAQLLGIDLAAVDLAVVSHGHYDHGGGLETFLARNRHAPVYVRREAFRPHFHGAKFIGLDPRLADHPRLVLTEGDLVLPGGLSLVQGQKHQIDRTLCVSGGQPDDFCHEQHLLVAEGGRKILFSGCSHRGILNIVDQFRPDVLVGGFHLKEVTDREALEGTARALLAYPTQYYTCHCTGSAQVRVMQEILGDRLGCLSAGDILLEV
ncbi:MAG: MBL fold metallo-hydrolase [Eubacteriales bacterium]|nr:MBL fold metallo-hydrolase [Eubacteriales bacterium]